MGILNFLKLRDMIKDLNINPRKWTREDAERVREYCIAHGGENVELFPSGYECGEEFSPTLSKVEKDGTLSVWYSVAGMVFHYRFA